MGITSASKTSWEWVKSCFNSAAWYEAALDHAGKAAPVVENALGNKSMTALNVAIVGGALYNSPQARGCVTAPGELAQKYINQPIKAWVDKKAPKNLQSSSKSKAIEEVVEAVEGLVGSAMVIGLFYAASNAATKIVKAALVERSTSSIKNAAHESLLEDTKAIGHAFLTIGDAIGYGLVHCTVDPATYIVKSGWNKTLGRVFNRHDDEPTSDIPGDIIDTDQA